jgi:hypothetical protein
VRAHGRGDGVVREGFRRRVWEGREED